MAVAGFQRGFQQHLVETLAQGRMDALVAAGHYPTELRPVAAEIATTPWGRLFEAYE